MGKNRSTSYAERHKLQPGDEPISPIFATCLTKHHSIYLGVDEHGTEWISENHAKQGVRMVSAQNCVNCDINLNVMATNTTTLPFGKRYGFEPIEVPLQLENIDSALRTELWNAFYIFILMPFHDADRYVQDEFRLVHKRFWVHYFIKPIDNFPGDYDFDHYVKLYIETKVWFKVYEFFEFIFGEILKNEQYSINHFIDYLNQKLVLHNSGYTIINEMFTPVTNEEEISEINNLVVNASTSNLNGVYIHLKSAIGLLSKKPQPDYRNSIKESISMVEAIARIIEPNEKTLGKALNKLEKNQRISPQLKLGFEQLYAYTNGKDGIRHAIMEENLIGIEDARFFLISCSSFTNYLIEKAKQQGLLKG